MDHEQAEKRPEDDDRRLQKADHHPQSCRPLSTGRKPLLFVVDCQPEAGLITRKEMSSTAMFRRPECDEQFPR
jgi:hypothetical protein